MSFTITETLFGPLPALTFAGDGALAVVTLKGATLISWSVGGVELIDGYANEREFVEQAGMRSAMMIPFSNRIPNGRYRFDGREIAFHADEPHLAGETVLHGLLRTVDFMVAHTSTAEDSATVRFESTALKPGAFSGYPFAVNVAIDIIFTGSGIEIAIEGVNVGETVAPFACGWHPYFMIGDAPLDELVAHIPAATRVVVDPDLIPLDGPDAFAPVTGQFDLREPRAIDGASLDVAFLDFEPGTDGRYHSTLSHPPTGRTIDAWQERGLMHVFTADTIPRPRQSFAMEAIEVMTNAVNRPDQADSLRLEPGQRRRFRFGVTTTLEMS